MAAVKAGRAKKTPSNRLDPAELSLDERIAKVLNHPMRTEILAMLGDGAKSPKELAQAVDGWKLSNVSYHCRELYRFDCVEIAGQEQIRGALKTKYRATTRMLLDRDNWDRLDVETRNGISINAVGEVIDRATNAIEGDTFDKRTDRAVVTLKMDADEQAWAEASQIVREAYERLSEVEAKVANRSGDKFRVTVSLLAYESPDN